MFIRNIYNNFKEVIIREFKVCKFLINFIKVIFFFKIYKYRVIIREFKYKVCKFLMRRSFFYMNLIKVVFFQNFKIDFEKNEFFRRERWVYGFESVLSELNSGEVILIKFILNYIRFIFESIVYLYCVVVFFFVIFCFLYI